jgi:hypothetical protein
MQLSVIPQNLLHHHDPGITMEINEIGETLTIDADLDLIAKRVPNAASLRGIKAV